MAPPGHSLHRCATELDLGPPSAYGWLATHGRELDFVKRYSWECRPFSEGIVSALAGGRIFSLPVTQIGYSRASSRCMRSYSSSSGSGSSEQTAGAGEGCSRRIGITPTVPSGIRSNLNSSNSARSRSFSSASLHDRVIAALERQPAERGVIVYGEGRVLATREPDMTVEAPSAVLVVLDPGAVSDADGRT